MTSFWRTGLALCSILALTACGSARLGGPSSRPTPVASARGTPVTNAPEPEFLEPGGAAPAGSVSSEPLPPPPGTPGPIASLDPSLPPPGGPIIADVPAPEARPATPEPQRVAVVSSGRSAVVGGWTAREATGSTCRVTLSSSPALDLYRASAAGCQNRDLARVSAWDFRDGEVYLYQPGGTVAARLRTAGGSLEGALAKSGAPLALSR